jgi:hypothetical protein
MVPESAADFETLFHLHYDRIAYAIARIVGDPAWHSTAISCQA